MAHSSHEQSQSKASSPQNAAAANAEESTTGNKLLRLANKINEELSDMDRPSGNHIKTLSMGGSYCDSACRLLLTAVSLTTFSFFAFHMGTQFRKDNGLLECRVASGQEQPLNGDLVGDSDVFNVSKHWLLLYYVHIGAGVYTIMQIIVATVAFQTKSRRTLCDTLVFPVTMIHLPLQLGLFIWVHIARFQPSGAVCAGDYLSEEEFEAVKDLQQEAQRRESLSDEAVATSAVELSAEEAQARSYLIQEGLFLKWWVIAWWTLFGLVSCCLCCVYCCCLKGRKPNLQLVSTRE